MDAYLAANRNALEAFLRELSDRLRTKGYTIDASLMLEVAGVPSNGVPPQMGAPSPFGQQPQFAAPAWGQQQGQFGAYGARCSAKKKNGPCMNPPLPGQTVCSTHAKSKSKATNTFGNFPGAPFAPQGGFPGAPFAPPGGNPFPQQGQQFPGAPSPFAPQGGAPSFGPPGGMAPNGTPQFPPQGGQQFPGAPSPFPQQGATPFGQQGQQFPGAPSPFPQQGGAPQFPQGMPQGMPQQGGQQFPPQQGQQFPGAPFAPQGGAPSPFGQQGPQQPPVHGTTDVQLTAVPSKPDYFVYSRGNFIVKKLGNDRLGVVGKLDNGSYIPLSEGDVQTARNFATIMRLENPQDVWSNATEMPVEQRQFDPSALAKFAQQPNGVAAPGNQQFPPQQGQQFPQAAPQFPPQGGMPTPFTQANGMQQQTMPSPFAPQSNAFPQAGATPSPQQAGAPQFPPQAQQTMPSPFPPQSTPQLPQAASPFPPQGAQQQTMPSPFPPQSTPQLPQAASPFPQGAPQFPPQANGIPQQTMPAPFPQSATPFPPQGATPFPPQSSALPQAQTNPGAEQQTTPSLPQQSPQNAAQQVANAPQVLNPKEEKVVQQDNGSVQNGTPDAVPTA